MYVNRCSKTISCGAFAWENLFRLCVFFYWFVCLFGICSPGLTDWLTDCEWNWMSLIHFYLLIICMDGVFNEIGDRLIRRDNIKMLYTFPKVSSSLHTWYMRVCVCFFMLLLLLMLLLLYLFWKFCNSILRHCHLQFSPTQFNRRNEREKYKREKKTQNKNNSNITNVLNIGR